MIDRDAAREELAGRYDELYRRSPFEDSPRFYERVIARARPARGSRVLDIGCGIGGALRAIEKAGARAIGVDLSREALARARARVPRALLVRADGARLPFSDASFDLVLNLGNLEHFADLTGGVREMRRVLTPAGRAWVLLPNLFYSGAIWRALRGGPGPDHHQPIDRFATRGEWRAVLEAGGLRVVRCLPHHRGKWWKRLLPSTLAWHFLFEVRAGEPSQERALPPLGRRRPPG